MALDQDLTPSPPKIAPGSGVDNEIATYRAIVPSAVLSLICGLLAVFSFTSWAFLAFTALAFGFGLRAERRIARDPEIWTGRKMAQAGIALGLVFGLAAVTNTMVQGFLRARAASQFAAQYAEVLKKRSLEEAAWYTAMPTGREGKSPVDLFKEMTSQAPPGMPDENLASIRAVRDRLASDPAEAITFEGLKGHGVDGLNIYASALFKLQGPGTKDHPEKEQYALFFFKGATVKGRTQWWVENTRFPYTPAS